jgi:hypothetical protein
VITTISLDMLYTWAGASLIVIIEIADVRTFVDYTFERSYVFFVQINIASAFFVQINIAVAFESISLKLSHSRL